jgi:two-component system phosphate regulon sensor histidine kinase PhoR
LARLFGVQRARDASPESAAHGLRELEPVLAALPDPVLLIDSAGRIAAANEPARARWGALHDSRLSAILRHPPLLDAAQASIRERTTQTVDYVTIAQAEEHFLVHVSPMNWAGDEASILVFRDRTAQTNAERMRVEFVANSSHELRTPLAALSMLIETIAGPARDNEADRARFLGMMQVQADRMRRLIDDLLALSRIELDEHVPPSDRADLAAVASDALASAEPLAAQRGVRLALNVRADVVPIVGDRFQLAQVAQNLIDNAIKFSPEGGVVEIEVGLADDREDALERSGRRWMDAGRISMLTPAPAPRTYAFLRVADHGPGIARRFLPRLGERFFRVEREEGSDRGGTGLGLAIVKHIVNRHRGGFVVESAPGRGSAFAVYFERAK